MEEKWLTSFVEVDRYSLHTRNRKFKIIHGMELVNVIRTKIFLTSLSNSHRGLRGGEEI